MQHPPELKTKFLELRARGIPYSRIAEELSVSKPTLIQWGKSMAEEIADVQAAERELVREKLLGNFEQWLGRQVHHFNRLDEEFGRREFKYSPTESVFRMMMASRKLLDRYFFDDDKPSRRAPRTSEPASSPFPGAVETRSPCKNDDAKLGKHEALTGSLALPQAAGEQFLGENENSKPPADSARIEMQNQTFSGPFLDQKDGGSSASAETQNPTFCPPFIHQKEGGNSSEPAPNPPSAPLHPCAELPAGDAPQADDPALQGESIPVNPYEPTREWLERQGIKVSKVPKGARVITAG
jgi:hypothetical protein